MFVYSFFFKKKIDCFYAGDTCYAQKESCESFSGVSEAACEDAKNGIGSLISVIAFHSTFFCLLCRDLLLLS
jgi:hypothetical protein